MAFLDWLVIAAFAALMIGIVWWVSRQKQENSDDYFLGGKDATWIAIGASIFASNIGSEHLIGLAGAGASSGMAMAHWEIQGWMILILGWVFVPFYTRSMVLTMPEFLERRYNTQSRTLLSFISLISYVMTKVAVTVYAGGLVFQQVFGIKELWGIDFFWISAIGLVLITAVYTIVGGLHFCASDSDTSSWFSYHPCSWFEGTWRLGRDDASLRRNSIIRGCYRHNDSFDAR